MMIRITANHPRMYPPPNHNLYRDAAHETRHVPGMPYGHSPDPDLLLSVLETARSEGVIEDLDRLALAEIMTAAGDKNEEIAAHCSVSSLSVQRWRQHKKVPKEDNAKDLLSLYPRLDMTRFYGPKPTEDNIASLRRIRTEAEFEAKQASFKELRHETTAGAAQPA